MTQPRVTGLRSIEYGMPDIRQAATFFEENWGLAPVATTDGAIYLRASGPEHHIAVVRQSPKTGHVRVNLAAPDKATVDALHTHAKGLGVDVLGAPAAIGEPDDALLAALLVKHFADRQLRVAPQVLSYLLPRMERSFAGAAGLVARLDAAALADQRPLSIPLVRRILADGSAHVSDLGVT